MIANHTTSVDVDNNNGKWICKFCHKTYSRNYTFKNHLSRCLVYQDQKNTKCSLMGDMITDLKQELLTGFKHELLKMLNEIKQEIHNNNQNQQKRLMFKPF